MVNVRGRLRRDNGLNMGEKNTNQNARKDREREKLAKNGGH
jgi:hypothetical protein